MISFVNVLDPFFSLTACGLGQDLAVLPQGDLTEVGEKGVSH
jgi:hypothetical protein